MQKLFAVIRTRGPAWQDSRPLEGQADWAGHASFMNALAKEGFVILGGPLEGTSDVLLIVRATTPDGVRSRLAELGPLRPDKIPKCPLGKPRLRAPKRRMRPPAPRVTAFVCARQAKFWRPSLPKLIQVSGNRKLWTVQKLTCVGMSTAA